MNAEVLNKTENRDVVRELIKKIQELINHKNLEPGDKLPSERVLAVRFNASRGNIRTAFQTLEYHELIKSIPQAGTFIADIGQIALNGIIDDIITLEKDSYKSLAEARINLEIVIAGQAAENRTEADLEKIESRFNAYQNKAFNGEDPLQEDLLFHLAISKSSGNATLHSFMLQITPKLLSVFEQNRLKKIADPEFITSKGPIDEKEISRHRAILEAIKSRDAPEAILAMKTHFASEIDIIKG